MKERPSANSLRWTLVVHCVLFVLLLFSFQFFWLDSKPYFVLGDDAMISMRYAWNWAHGFGVFWNTYSTPEGYSNFLLVGVMALYHEIAALLGIPINLISGMILLTNLIVALVAICLMHLLVLELTGSRPAALIGACSLAVNAQFLYWGKAGFETTLLVTFMIGATLLILKRRYWTGSLLLSGAVLARDDAVLLVAVFAIVQLTQEKRGAWKRFLSLSLFPVLAVVLHLIFRIWYYGDPLPNTYYLKATQLPISFRLDQGAAYVIGELPSLTIAAWILKERLRDEFGTASGSLRRVLIALLSLMPVYLLYALWVAGDAFPGSRLFACIWIVPCVAVAMFAATPNYSMSRLICFAIYFMIVAVSPLNRETVTLYHGELKAILSVIQRRHAATYFSNVSPIEADEPVRWNAINTWECVAVRNDAHLRGLSHASIAVYFAGMAPYFCPEFEAIDLLGKSDAVIAKEPPHIPGRIGHNKYDYEFSLSKYKPTYILSQIPNTDALDDVAYLNRDDGQFNFNRLALDREFRLHYRDRVLSHTEPVIFVRDDAR